MVSPDPPIARADSAAPAGRVASWATWRKAASTLGTFLRSFRWGRVRQLDRVSRELLSRAWAAGAGPGAEPFTIDLDSTICETYGLAKGGALHHGYTVLIDPILDRRGCRCRRDDVYAVVRGYHPLLAVAAGTGDVELAEPKTLRSRRTIRIPDTIVGVLRAHRARQLEERLAAGPGWQDWGLVFTTSIGTPLHRADVLYALRRQLTVAGLPRMRFQDLRHACASLLLAQGVHPRVVMEILGHSTIGLTMDTYSHVLPQLQRAEPGRVDPRSSPPGHVRRRVL